jgi:hypothetical protein
MGLEENHVEERVVNSWLLPTFKNDEVVNPDLSTGTLAGGAFLFGFIMGLSAFSDLRVANRVAAIVHRKYSGSGYTIMQQVLTETRPEGSQSRVNVEDHSPLTLVFQ